MDTTIFLILIAQLIIIIALSVMTFKDQILNFVLGIRRKRAVFLDIRKSMFITLSKDLKSFEAFNRVFIWNFNKELNGCSFYRSDNSEPLAIELEVEKCRYWCDSNEYHTNLKNKLLETMMMLKNKDQIIIMLIISIFISLAVLALVYFKTGSIQDSLNNIQNSISVINQSSQDMKMVI